MSIPGHHTNIRARPFICVMPGWASCSSSRTALRCQEGTITRDPQEPCCQMLYREFYFIYGNHQMIHYTHTYNTHWLDFTCTEHSRTDMCYKITTTHVYNNINKHTTHQYSTRILCELQIRISPCHTLCTTGEYICEGYVGGWYIGLYPRYGGLFMYPPSSPRGI